jgi:hypothetical protein
MFEVTINLHKKGGIMRVKILRGKECAYLYTDGGFAGCFCSCAEIIKNILKVYFGLKYYEKYEEGVFNIINREEEDGEVLEIYYYDFEKMYKINTKEFEEYENIEELEEDIYENVKNLIQQIEEDIKIFDKELNEQTIEFVI